jgi:exo-1,4-beta-D-glucosaminidase
MDMTEKYSRSAKVDVGSDGKTEAYKIEWPENLSKTFFLSLKLMDNQGDQLSENFYWLSTSPDIQGSKDEVRTGKGWGILKANPRSYADFTGLNHLPSVKLETKSHLSIEDGIGRIEVSMRNTTDNPAFMVVLAIRDKSRGEEVAPIYWQDNYFTILPGEDKQVYAEFPAQGVDQNELQFVMDGWNVD